MRCWTVIISLLLALPAMSAIGQEDDFDLFAEEFEEEFVPPDVNTVRLNTRGDRLILTDGTEVRGTIVVVGARAVVIVTATGEETVPRHKIERIRRAPPGDLSTPRTFETAVGVDHERIVVAPGIDELGQLEAIPPGLDPQVAEQMIELAYAPEQGLEIAAELDISIRRYEERGARAATGRTERIHATVMPVVTQVRDDGSWVTEVAYHLDSLLRGHADVTPLHQQKVGGVTVIRTLSPNGIWRPDADGIRGAPATERQYFEWLNYVTVPVPARPVVFGSPVELNDVVTRDVARALLPPPAHLSVPGWTITGTYVIHDTREIEGVRCARITMDLRGRGSGEGTYQDRAAHVDVDAESRWTVFFDIEAGRPHSTRVETSIRATIDDRRGEELDLTISSTAEAAVTTRQPEPDRRPDEEPAPPEDAEADEPDLDLDEVMEDAD